MKGYSIVLHPATASSINEIIVMNNFSSYNYSRIRSQEKISILQRQQILG